MAMVHFSCITMSQDVFVKTFYRGEKNEKGIYAD